jgi:hypothetical protein
MGFALQTALQDSVLDDFKLLLGPSDVQLSADNTERLSSACLVVNALGPKVRAAAAGKACAGSSVLEQCSTVVCKSQCRCFGAVWCTFAQHCSV